MAKRKVVGRKAAETHAAKPPATAKAGATSVGQQLRQPATAATKPVAKPKPIRVTAIAMGYYDHLRRRVGDTFDIADESHFSDKWMERVDPKTPLQITTPNQALRRAHDDILAMKDQASREGMHVGPDNVPAGIPTGTANPIGDDFGDDD